MRTFGSLGLWFVVGEFTIASQAEVDLAEYNP